MTVFHLLLLQSATPAAQGAQEMPALRRGLAAAVVASGLFWCPQPVPTVTIEKWNQPFSQPTLRRGLPTGEQQSVAFVKASPFPETVTVSRWLQPLSEPVRQSPRLQQAVAYTPFIPASATVSGSDVRSTSGPVYGRTIIFPSRFAPVSVPAEVVTADKWFAELSSPQRQRLGLAARHQQAVAFVEAAPFQETVSLDRWLQPLAEPVRVRPRLGTGAQQHSALVQAAPFAETVSADRWALPFAQPTLRKRQVQPDAVSYAYYVAVAPETITPDKWHVEWSTPVRRKGLPVNAQQATAFAQASPFAETVTVSRWLQPLSEPVRIRPRFQQAVAYTPTEVATVSGSDVRSSSGPIYGRTIVFQSRFVPVPVPAEVVTPVSWLRAFGLPQRMPGGLAAQFQQSLAFWPLPIPAATVVITGWIQPVNQPQQRTVGAQFRYQAVWPDVAITPAEPPPVVIPVVEQPGVNDNRKSATETRLERHRRNMALKRQHEEEQRAREKPPEPPPAPSPVQVAAQRDDGDLARLGELITALESGRIAAAERVRLAQIEAARIGDEEAAILLLLASM